MYTSWKTLLFLESEWWTNSNNELPWPVFRRQNPKVHILLSIYLDILKVYFSFLKASTPGVDNIWPMSHTQPTNWSYPAHWPLPQAWGGKAAPHTGLLCHSTPRLGWAGQGRAAHRLLHTTSSPSHSSPLLPPAQFPVGAMVALWLPAATPAQDGVQYSKPRSCPACSDELLLPWRH